MRGKAVILSIALLLLGLLAGAPVKGQIVNRLKVDDPTFQRYAWGRMQHISPTTKRLFETLDAIAEEKPDLILLDLMMPGIDGFEVIRRLRSNEETAPASSPRCSSSKPRGNRTLLSILVNYNIMLYICRNDNRYGHNHPDRHPHQQDAV